MFSTKKNQGITLSILLSAGLFVSACGGGGGGSSASTTPATSKASSAATKSIVSTVGAGGAGIDAGSAKPSLKGDASGAENDATLIRKGIERLKARMQGGGGRQKAMMAVTGPTVNCGISGTEQNLVDDKDTADTADDEFITTYVNCRENKEAGLDRLKNGTEKFSFAGGLFSSSFSNSDATKGFEESEIDTTSGDRVIKFESTKGTLAMTGGSFSDQCPDEFFAQDAVLTMNMTVEEKKDEDATVDGFEKHELFTANNFTMKITDNFNATDCTFVSEVIVLNGTTSFEDKLNAASDDNYSASFADFTVTITDRKDPTSGAFLGEEIALSGSVTITSTCATGTYTVATTTPLFFPDGAACPVEGRIDVTGGGGTSAVLVNGDGSVDFDDNGDGNVDDNGNDIVEPGEGKHFDTCEDADVCHT